MGGLGLFAFNGLSAQRSPMARAQTQPVNMGAALNAAGRDSEPTFGTDRRTMYFNCADRTPTGGNDICTSTLVDGEWTPAVIVPAPISTEYSEVELLLSLDGNQLYIMSNRPGGLGSADIWVSDKVDGEWTEPKNLGPQVNSAGSEHHSLPSADGRSLYITATWDEGYGEEEDIYVTHRDDRGVWGPLLNLGPLVNTEESDRCPVFSPRFRDLLLRLREGRRVRRQGSVVGLHREHRRRLGASVVDRLGAHRVQITMAPHVLPGF